MNKKIIKYLTFFTVILFFTASIPVVSANRISINQIITKRMRYTAMTTM